MSKVHEELANLRQATIRARPLRGGRFPFGSISLADLRELVKATENYSERSRVDMRSNRLSVTDATPDPQSVDREEWLGSRRESADRLYGTWRGPKMSQEAKARYRQ